MSAIIVLIYEVYLELQGRLQCYSHESRDAQLQHHLLHLCATVYKVVYVSCIQQTRVSQSVNQL
jgi:hypothetical protein